jgi:HAD superfamily hydrolase (TIGR01549 family)
MGIISDFDERLHGIVQGLGIGSYTKFIVQSYVEGYSKPSAELYAKAKQHAGSIDESWHVGDDPEKDAFTGTKTIIVDRENKIATDFQKISTLDELPALLNN